MNVIPSSPVTSFAPFNFSLAPHIYATSFDNAIIILDSAADKYISLVDDAAQFFQFILAHQFIKQDATYHATMAHEDSNNSQHNYWISYFIEKKFIIPGTHTTHLMSPIQSGGLIGYRWDFKKSWKPFAQSSFLDIFKAYYMLARVHRIIQRKGIAGVIALVKKQYNQKNPYIPSPEEIQKLSASVDAASLLYPKKTLCLAWATTYVALALRKNWKISLVIGVQTNPFYAHAWAETSSGHVINDDPLVAQALSIIFREPY